MKIKLIGLGKMGFPLALNMLRNGHEVLAFDVSAAAREQAQAHQIPVVHDLAALCQTEAPPRIFWLMVPAGTAVRASLQNLMPFLRPNDVVIDGGNSHFKDSLGHAQILAEQQVHFLDCGTSGGVSGALNGICAMVGGEEAVFQRCEPLFKDISLPHGYLYCGKSGSGHFVKMVHNGIEYGMMQAIAEGFELMQSSDFNLDLGAVAGLWNRGSVVRSWLMELTAGALQENPNLDGLKGIMHASGEGQWMIETAIEQHIPTPVIALSLMMRYRSQQEDTFSGKVVAALRNAFGGHAVEKISG